MNKCEYEIICTTFDQIKERIIIRVPKAKFTLHQVFREITDVINTLQSEILDNMLKEHISPIYSPFSCITIKGVGAEKLQAMVNEYDKIGRLAMDRALRQKGYSLEKQPLLGDKEIIALFREAQKQREGIMQNYYILKEK